MTKTIAWGALAVLWVAMVTPALSQKTTQEIDFFHSVVSLEIPPLAQLKKDPTPRPGFSIYSIVAQSKPLLGIYVGAAPDRPARDALTLSYIGKCIAFERKHLGSKGRDVFVPFGSSPHLDHWMHLYYGDLELADARKADAILNSLTPVRGVGCFTAFPPEEFMR